MPILDHLSFSQMIKMYSSHWGNKSEYNEDGYDVDENENLELPSALSQNNITTSQQFDEDETENLEQLPASSQHNITTSNK